MISEPLNMTGTLYRGEKQAQRGMNVPKVTQSPRLWPSAPPHHRAFLTAAVHRPRSVQHPLGAQVLLELQPGSGATSSGMLSKSPPSAAGLDMSSSLPAPICLPPTRAPRSPQLVPTAGPKECSVGQGKGGPVGCQAPQRLDPSFILHRFIGMRS